MSYAPGSGRGDDDAWLGGDVEAVADIGKRDPARALGAGALKHDRGAPTTVARPVKVLVVTAFNLDEYVYEALRAGASGFLLKDAPPAQLLHGIRTVASGAALLAPEVTRQLVGRYVARIRPADGAAARNPLTPGSWRFCA